MNALASTMNAFNQSYAASRERKQAKKQQAFQNQLQGMLGGGASPMGGVGTPGIVPNSQSGAASSPLMGGQVQSQQPQAQQPQAGGMDQVSKYQQAANFAAQSGRPDLANQYMKMAGSYQTQGAASAKSQADLAKTSAATEDQETAVLYNIGKGVMDGKYTLDQAKQYLQQNGADAQELAQITDQTLPQQMAMIEARMRANPKSRQTLKDKEAIYDSITNEIVASNRGFTAEQNGDESYGFNTATGEFSDPVTRAQTYEEAETGRSNVAQEGIDQFGNTTDRMNANTDRMEAENTIATGGGGEYGTTVHYAEKDGQTIGYVQSKDGSSKVVSVDGASILSPYEKKFQESSGSASGKNAVEDKKFEKVAVETAKKNTTKVNRLMDGGDLNKGFSQAFGLKGVALRNTPGHPARDAWAQLQEITGPQTLDELAKMKGVPSDRDIDLVKGAATSLNDPRISASEAKIKLKEISDAYARILSMPDVGANKPGSIMSGPNKELYNKYGLE